MSLLNILIGTALLLTSPGPLDSLSDSPSPAPISVVSMSHDVLYPDEVVFTLEAEADAQITAVTFYYAFAGQKTTLYGYPTFVPGNRISAEYRLKTGGSSYIPGGTVIHYHYLLEDAEGNTLTGKEMVLEYTDPQYEWERLREGDLLVLWHDRPADRVGIIVADVNERLSAVKSLLGIEKASAMKAVVLNNSREAERGFPTVSAASKQEYLYGGFAFGDFDLFVLVGLTADRMVHEATHLLLDEAVGSPLARLPAWLNEGLAMYFETDTRGREARVVDAALHDSLMDLRSMNSVPGKPDDVRLFYAQSWSLVRYLVDTLGAEHIPSILAAINSGSPIDEAVQQVYGKSLEDLEDQWKTEVVQAMPLAPRSGLGVVSVGTIIACAVLIAVAVTAFRWVRHRRQRL